MKEEYAKRWVEALRSGKYKQGKNNLHNLDGSMCCLGVLCDIVKDELNLKWSTMETYHMIDGVGGVLSSRIQEYVGMKDTDGSYKQKGKQVNHLPSYNDNGKSFNHIANLIEKRWEKM